MKSGKTIILLAAILLVPQIPLARAQQAPWRPTVMSMRGMVAAGHPLAAEAGLRILKQGGNAVDAALATWFVQGQVEPAMSGIGGDMFILIYLAKSGEVKFINGTGPAPQASTAEFYRAKGGIPNEGALSVDVRGVRGVGSVKAILIHPVTKVLMGGVSPTRDSYVMGW